MTKADRRLNNDGGEPLRAKLDLSIANCEPLQDREALKFTIEAQNSHHNGMPLRLRPSGRINGQDQDFAFRHHGDRDVEELHPRWQGGCMREQKGVKHRVRGGSPSSFRTRHGMGVSNLPASHATYRSVRHLLRRVVVSSNLRHIAPRRAGNSRASRRAEFAYSRRLTPSQASLRLPRSIAHMIGAVVGLILLVVLLGALFYCARMLLPLISPILRILIILLVAIVALYVIIVLLGFFGIHVPVPGFR
jgi:hypothetical protein